MISCGASLDQIPHFATESETFDADLDWAEEADLVVILDLGRHSGILEKLESMQS